MLSLILRHSPRQLLQSSMSLAPRRTFIFGKKSEKTLIKEDNIGSGFTVIYKAPMEAYLKTCNYVTTGSVIAFGAFAIHKFYNPFAEVSSERHAMEFLGNAAVMSENDVTFFVIGLIGFCVAIRMIIYKYPLRIYKNENKFIAVFEGHLPLTKNKLFFDKGQVKELPPTGFLPWREFRYLIKNRSTIMFFEHFRTPYELQNMMTPVKTPKAVKK